MNRQEFIRMSKEFQKLKPTSAELALTTGTPTEGKSALILSKTIGYFSVDASFTCLSWNEKMVELTGCNNLISKSLIEKYPDFSSSELYTQLYAIFNHQVNEELVLFDTNFWSKETSFIYYTIIPEFAQDGKTTNCHILCQHPILKTNSISTAQLPSAKKFNEPYYLIFEKLNIPSVISRYGVIQHANKAILDLLELDSNDEFVGTNVLDRVAPHQREELNNVIIARYNGIKLKHPLFLDIQKKDSGYITCEVKISFIDLPDGMASVVSLQDVSEKIKIQNALVESEAKFRQMFESTFVGIMFVDNHGYITEVNDRFLEIIGYTREEFAKQKLHWEQITPAEYLEQDYKIMNQLITHGHIIPYEKEFCKKDGSQVPVLITSSYLKNEGKHFGVGFLIDLTELKQSKEETLKVTNELSTFLYMASHDLKGPLASVMGLTQLALNEIKEPKTLYYLNLIKECTNKLDNSLVNFLKIIKIKNSIFEKTRIDFVKLINESISDYRHLVDSDVLSFQIEVDEVSEFFSDEDLIRTILHNLIENSVKYSIRSRKTFILIKIKASDNNLIIRIEDNGKGIDEKIMHKIFNLFFRGDNNSNGSGLGLYIVKSAAENLNGTVNVFNKEEGGVAFEVTLPYMEN